MENQEKLDEAIAIVNQKLKEESISLTVTCTLPNIPDGSNNKYNYGNE